jgi:hypothetical protein
MHQQTSVASIISPPVIEINDGSLEGSITRYECPDFSSAERLTRLIMPFQVILFYCKVKTSSLLHWKKAARKRFLKIE